MAPKTTHTLRWIAWGTWFLAILLLVAGSAGMPLGLQVLLLVLSLAALGGLVGLYHRALACWRAVLAAWLAYVICRLLTVWLPHTGAPFLAQTGALLAALLSVEAMVAALLLTANLSVWRDVSVAYVVLSFGAGAWLMLYAVRAAGGVLNLFTAALTRSTFQGFSLSEPLFLSIACMVPLGFLTFVPHFLCQLAREVKGE